MNIFVLDQDPRVCARYHNDKHVVKMILETAQLLCGVHHVTESNLDVPYGLSHKNHPCSIWARKCLENYIWLCELGMELSTEYTHRYGRRHKSQDIIEWCLINLPNLPEFGRITEQPKAMPDECKTDDVVESYRRYYIMEKRGFCNWKNREIPNWYKINLDN
tara:strand:- start:908 stop:1393 length:486 start_codon:yes stop_codon:yes gene_type:complete